MGRLLKRVPLDFNWPMGKTWHGYYNPHYVKCPHCDGRGITAGRERLSDIVSLLMLSGEDSTKGQNHPYFDHIRRGVYGFNCSPSSDLGDLTAGLAGRSGDRYFGHDASDRWRAIDKIIRAAGLDPETWGRCKECDGEGIPKDAQEQYNSWQEFDPPVGDGYQLWENTSEGSPISPVFATLEKLCQWLGDNNASVFGSSTASKEEWMQMLSEDFVHHKEGGIVFI